MTCTGKILDSAGNALSDVKCEVIDTSSGSSLATFYSDQFGHYDFQILNDPDLQVCFSHPEYTDQQIQPSGDPGTCIILTSCSSQRNAHESITIGDINTVVVLIVAAIILGLIFF